ncbi:MAG: vWA domain-containing protein [Myxococcota bacterium]
MVRRHNIAHTFVLGAVLALSASAQGVQEHVWIDIHGPPKGSVQRLPVAIVEVSGVVGAGRPHYHDLAIVLDLSVSTRLPSGVDVDSDGHLGRSSPEIREDYWGSAAPELLCDDADDTIAAAELAAVRRLLSLLDPRLTRVALIAFGDRGLIEAPLESTREEVLAALAVLDGKHGWYGGTNYSAGLRAAVRALLDAPQAGDRDRKRSILFLSDGYPTMPLPEPLPAQEAVAAARETAQAGVHVHGFALGPEGIRGREIFELIARLSRGTTTEIARPGDILFHLPSVELSEIAEVVVRNDTSGEAGRAVRLFADGSFDGFVPLQPGRNLLRVSATGVGGASASVVREVFYDPPGRPTRELELEVDRLRDLIRNRTVEVELTTEIRRAREQRREALRKRLKVWPEN